MPTISSRLWHHSVLQASLGCPSKSMHFCADSRDVFLKLRHFVFFIFIIWKVHLNSWTKPFCEMWWHKKLCNKFTSILQYILVGKGREIFESLRRVFFSLIFGNFSPCNLRFRFFIFFFVDWNRITGYFWCCCSCNLPYCA